MADALALAREAFGLAPERIAVSSRLAELQIKTDDSKRAMKTLERGWALAPHPDLAELYLKASGETELLKRVGVFIEAKFNRGRAEVDIAEQGRARTKLRTLHTLSGISFSL